MLGIILFLTKYNDKLVNSNIIIHDDLFRNIAKVLFSNLTIKKHKKIDKDAKDSKDIELNNYFDINIRNNVQHGLVINNILNLSKIQNKNFYLLPWYNKDNPMIAFIAKSETMQITIENVVDDIKKFTNIKRMLPHNPNNFIDIQCKINIWDSLTEYKILLNYGNKYLVDIVQTYTYISKALGEHMCIPKEITYVGVPVPIKINIPVKNNENQDEQILLKLNKTLEESKQILTETKQQPVIIQTNAANTCQTEDCSKYIKIINTLDKKIQALNKIYDNKI